MSKIIVVGDYNADLVLYLDRFPKPGETLNGKSFFEGPGGKGSNQAIAAARLGAKVTFFGALGKDHRGRAALETWRAEGIDTGWVLQSAESDTAVAMIYVDSAGHNMIAVAQGANLLRKPEDLDSLAESIAGADMLVCTLGVPLAVAERALILAKRAGTPTLLNPAPAARLTRAMLEAADYITPNESELDILLGSANPSGDDSRADASGMNGNAAGGPADGLVSRARALLCRDDQTLIVTLGAEGARWISRAHTELVPAFRVTAVDTVGAGDCFNAAAAVALAEGKPLTEAVRFANAAAALSVTKRGAVAGMPFRKDCEAFLGI